MTNSKIKEKNIYVSNIILDLENPRYDKCKSQSDAIASLCKTEQIYALAKDIMENGLNPLEKFALLEVKEDGKRQYVVLEGNRRACALTLLKTPKKGPVAEQERFKRLGKKYDPIKMVPAVVFSDRQTARIWLERLHDGPQGGRGRKKWDARQRERFSNTNRNAIAAAILDYAEDQQWVTTEETRGRLTTLSRYVNNPLFRKTTGILSVSADGHLETNLNEEEFARVLKILVDELVSNKLSSRSDAKDIVRHGEQLAEQANLPEEREEIHSSADFEEEVFDNSEQSAALEANLNDSISSGNGKPKKQTKISRSSEIKKRLEEGEFQKLSSIYYSLTTLSVTNHTPLLTIGAWAFLEILSKSCGAKDNVSFESFFSKQRLKNDLHFPANKERAISEAISRISRYGNITKHDENSGAFNGEQLINDMKTLDELIVKSLDELLSKAKKGS
ncbi:hypothetical protein ACMG4P_11215 [Pseudovibrio denitrificans]|uniref:hypothetical protein n=1 Tax=Pseudovibrio denitrificans TaxID=258256 RepID=UPI0039BFBAAF